jgi:type VI secretion system protein ImpG
LALTRLESSPALDAENPFAGLSDFFNFPERFLFVNLNLTEVSIKQQDFAITIDFTEPVVDLRVQPDLFKLYCVPAINLFTAHSEPIFYNANRHDYSIAISHDQPDSKSLFAVKRVRAIAKNGSDIIEFKNFHQNINSGQSCCYYRLSQTREKKNVIHNQLSFSGDLHQKMHISCDVVANNSYYPRQFLNVNSLFLKDNRVSLQVQAKNITRPSRYYYPFFDSQYAVLVLSTLNIHLKKLANASFLKQLLHLHDWSKNNTKIINAISNITITPFNRFKRGALQRGVEFSLAMNLESNTSRSEINLFGEIIHLFVKQFTPLNTRFETKLIIMPEEFILKWGFDGRY